MPEGTACASLGELDPQVEGCWLGPVTSCPSPQLEMSFLFLVQWVGVGKMISNTDPGWVPPML